MNWKPYNWFYRKRYRILEVTNGNGDKEFWVQYKDGIVDFTWTRFKNYLKNQPHTHSSYNEANEWLCSQIHEDNAEIINRTSVHKPDPIFNKLQSTTPSTVNDDEGESPF